MHLPITIGISPTLKFRGILASEKIKKGKVIERCPIIPIPKKRDMLKTSIFNKYYFEWNANHHVLALGYGSLINHSYTPNAKYHFDYINKYVVFSAIKDIEKGEEITVNYNFYPDSKESLDPQLLDHNIHMK